MLPATWPLIKATSNAINKINAHTEWIRLALACSPRDGAVRVHVVLEMGQWGSGACASKHTHVHAAGAYWLRHTAVAHAIHMYCPVLCLVVPIHVPNYISHGVTVCLSSGTTIEATASCFMAFYKGTVHQFDSLMNDRPLCVIKASTTGIVRWVMYSSHLCSHYNTYSAKPSVRHSQIRRVAFFSWITAADGCGKHVIQYLTLLNTYVDCRVVP